MDNTTFENLVKEIRAASMDTLTAKNAKYATDGDRLHNFVAGGGVMGGTAAQACWGYLTKHLVALRDRVERNDFSDREDLKEKCQDAINYIVFLWCIGNEERAKEAHLKCARAEDEPVEGLGLSPAERAKYEPDNCVTYRDVVKRICPNAASDVTLSGMLGCPGTYLEGATNIGDGACDSTRACKDCWTLPYKGERARDVIGGD